MPRRPIYSDSRTHTPNTHTHTRTHTPYHRTNRRKKWKNKKKNNKNRKRPTMVLRCCLLFVRSSVGLYSDKIVGRAAARFHETRFVHPFSVFTLALLDVHPRHPTHILYFIPEPLIKVKSKNIKKERRSNNKNIPSDKFLPFNSTGDKWYCQYSKTVAR